MKTKDWFARFDLIASKAAERGFAADYFVLRRVRRSERNLAGYRCGLELEQPGRLDDGMEFNFKYAHFRTV